MNCIVIEGEKGKSEYIFWEWLVRNYMENTELLPLGGNTRIQPTLKQLVQSNKYTGILVCYDTTVYDIVALDIAQSINKIKTHNTGISIDFLRYYCFEDIFLLFPNICQWLFSSNRLRSERVSSILDIIADYQTCFSTPTDGQDWAYNTAFCSKLYSNNILSETEYTKNITSNPFSREWLAAKILGWLNNKRTVFEIQKGTLSKCWLCNCIDSIPAQMSSCRLDCYKEQGRSNKFIDNYECGFYKGRKSARYKMHYLLTLSPMLSELRNIDFLEWKKL